MRILLVLTLVAVVRASGPDVPAPHDGQPGCRIRYEFTRLWRNNFENGVYWQCETWRVPASLRQCPSGTWFQDAWQVCVPFHQWRWTPYSEPPTRPSCDETDECEEIEIEIECPVECIPTDPPTTTTPVTVTTPTTTTPTTTTPTTTTPTTTTPTTTTPTTTTPTTTTPTTTTPTTTTPTTTTPTTTTSTTTTTTTTTTTPEPTTTTEPTTTIGTIPLETTTEPCPIPPGLTQLCPGASAEQHTPGDVSCDSPRCVIGSGIAGTLFPSRNPTTYFRCGVGNGRVIEMNCAVGTCFSNEHQSCVDFRTWQNSCW